MGGSTDNRVVVFAIRKTRLIRRPLFIIHCNQKANIPRDPVIPSSCIGLYARGKSELRGWPDCPVVFTRAFLGTRRPEIGIANVPSGEQDMATNIGFRQSFGDNFWAVKCPFSLWERFHSVEDVPNGRADEKNSKTRFGSSPRKYRVKAFRHGGKSMESGTKNDKKRKEITVR